MYYSRSSFAVIHQMIQAPHSPNYLNSLKIHSASKTLSVSRMKKKILLRGSHWWLHKADLGKIWIIWVCGNSHRYKRLFELRNSYLCGRYECQCNVLSSQMDWDHTALEVGNAIVCRFINKIGSPQTKFATHGSAAVIVISFVFWWVKYDAWASAFQMSLHWSQGPISLGKDNHFLVLSFKPWDGRRCSRGGREPDGYYADFWGMEGKQKGNGGGRQTQSSISESFFPFISVMAFYVQCPNDRKLVNREVENRLSNDIFLHSTAHASHTESELCGVAFSKVIQRLFGS